MTNPLLEAALAYAAQGLRIFPLHAIENGRCSCGRDCGKDSSKHPRIKAWQKTATTDPDQIRRWWAPQGGKWPSANIGLVTEKVAVIDIDGSENLAFLKGLAAPHGGLPETVAVSTRRGFHLYYGAALPSSKTIGGAPAAEGRAAVPGLLVRGAGGYVVAPPSVHASGHVYKWVIKQGVGLVVLPAWFRAQLQTPGGTQVSGISPRTLPTHLSNRKQRLVGGALRNVAERSLAALGAEWSEVEEARIKSALLSIPANCDRGVWLSVGMALHSTGWEEGLRLWDEWSRTGGEKYQGIADLETRWRSFRRSGVSLGTLFHLAGEAGWSGQVDLKVNQLAPSAVEAASPHQAPGGTQAPNSTPINGFHSGPTVAAQAFAPTRPIFLDVDKANRPKVTCLNTAVAIQLLGVACRHDVFHDKILVGGKVIDEWAGDISDNALQMLRVLIRREFQFDPGIQNAHDAAVQEALQHSFDPVQDYLDALEWDRVPRLGGWMAEYLGAERTGLNAEIGRLSLAAAVRRAREPGHKFDQIVVLESPEGMGKSSAIEALAGEDSFSDQPLLNLDDRGQQEAMQGVWLYELADLAGMSRAEVERVKAFASRRVDRARPAYGRTRVDRPRRCVFFASTNNETYLKSHTGNRRFWPVRTGRVRLDELRRDRDQLWAEAVHVEGTAVPLSLAERFWADATALQDTRRDHDPWDDILQSVKGIEHPTPGGMEYRVSVRNLIEMELKLSVDRVSDLVAKRIAFCMRRLGWTGPNVFRDGQIITRGYTRNTKVIG